MLLRPLTCWRGRTIEKFPLNFQQRQLVSISREDTLEQQGVGFKLQSRSLQASISEASQHEINLAQRKPILEGLPRARKQNLTTAVGRQAKEMIVGGERNFRDRALVVTAERQLGVRKGVASTLDCDEFLVRVRVGPPPRRDVFQRTNKMSHMSQSPDT